MREQLFFQFLTLLDHSSWLRPYFEIYILYLSSFTSYSGSSVNTSSTMVNLTGMSGSSASLYGGYVRVSNAIAASDLSLQDWVAKCLPSSSLTISNFAASAVLPIVKILSSNPTVGACYAIVSRAFTAGSAAAAGRLAHQL